MPSPPAAPTRTSGSDFVSAVIAQAGLFGLAWWERLALILGLAILTVLGKRAFLAIRFAPIPPEWDPEKGTGPLAPPIGMDATGTVALDQKPQEPQP